MEGKDKNIYDMLDVKQGDISSKDFLKRCHIDTIVNAAKYERARLLTSIHCGSREEIIPSA